MTQEQLDAIRTRCEKATPGPWRKTGAYNHFIDAKPDSECVHTFIAEMWGVAYPETEKQAKMDTDFIAHSREDIPDLLDELKECRDENDTLYKALEIAAEEHRVPISDWDKQKVKIVSRWIRIAEALK